MNGHRSGALDSAERAICGGWAGAQDDDKPYDQMLAIGGRRFDTRFGILLQSRLEVRNTGQRGHIEALWGSTIEHAAILQPLPLMMSALLLYMLFMRVKAATARNGRNMGGVTADGGEVISVTATFTGVRELLSLFAIANNNAIPLFAVNLSWLKYHVIRKQNRRFTEIELIDSRTAWRTVNFDVLFRGDPLTLAINVGTEEAARKVLPCFPAATPMTMLASALSIPIETLQYDVRDFTE